MRYKSCTTCNASFMPSIVAGDTCPECGNVPLAVVNMKHKNFKANDIMTQFLLLFVDHKVLLRSDITRRMRYKLSLKAISDIIDNAVSQGLVEADGKRGNKYHLSKLGLKMTISAFKDSLGVESEPVALETNEKFNDIDACL